MTNSNNIVSNDGKHDKCERCGAKNVSLKLAYFMDGVGAKPLYVCPECVEESATVRDLYE